MKKIIFLTILTIATISCKDQSKEQDEQQEQEIAYTLFGKETNVENAINTDEMFEKFQSLQKEGDSIPVKFKSTISEVCQKKGCWMTMDLNEEKDVLVSFNYDFFVPLDAADRETIVEGQAFVTIRSVEELREIAKDRNQPQEEIDAITEPKIRYMILAKSVLIKNEDTQEAIN